ncbi:MAG: hypothetical protein M1365_00175 [Actinobacteria bacterium]|nr:hypothetical protein [Actinomycetota bacterium]
MLEFLRDRAQREFRNIVKKHGSWIGTNQVLDSTPYQKSEPHLENEPTSLIEKVKLITAFHNLQTALNFHMIKGKQVEYPYYLTGVTGDLYFRFSSDENKPEKIEVSRKIRRNTGITEVEYFSVSSSGDAEYVYSSGHAEAERQTRHGIIKVNGLTHNKDLVIDNVTEITSEICEAINNPEYRTYHFKQKVREIRKELMEYFKRKGLSSEEEKQTRPKASADHTYKGIRLPKLPGTWSVQYKRAKIVAHGITLILTNELYDEKRVTSYLDNYVFCENGDLQVSFNNRHAFLSSFSEEGQPEIYMHDPHFALAMAKRLERQITRKPTETELAALKHDLTAILG